MPSLISKFELISKLPHGRISIRILMVALHFSVCTEETSLDLDIKSRERNVVSGKEQI